jgi:hypothetical protein
MALMEEPMAQRRVIVGCGILEDELSYVLKDERGFDCELVWLKSGYHVRTDLLARKLAEALDGGGLKDGPELRVLYGSSCLLDLDPEFRAGLRSLPTENCLTAMVGLKRLRELERDRTMVVTNSWIRRIYLSPDEEFPIWDPAEMRMQLGRYDRILVLDTGLDSFTDEEILTAYDLMGVVLEFEKCDLGYFRRLITDFLA